MISIWLYILTDKPPRPGETPGITTPINTLSPGPAAASRDVMTPLYDPLGPGPPMTWCSAERVTNKCLAKETSATPDLETRSSSQPLPQLCLSLYHQVRATRKDHSQSFRKHLGCDALIQYLLVFYHIAATSGATWRLLSTGQPHVSSLVLIQPLIPRLFTQQRLLPSSQCAALPHHHPSFRKEVRLHPQAIRVYIGDSDIYSVHHIVWVRRM